ncbi:MAG: OmpA family protein [Bacteroidia bacterium]
MNKIIGLTYFFLAVITLAACVPQRKFAELESKYTALTADKTNVDSLYNLVQGKYEALKKQFETLSINNEKLTADFKEMEALYDRIKKAHDQLTETYEKRLASESLTKDELKKSLRELENKLVKKELELNEKEANLIRKEEETKKLNDEVSVIEKSLKEREEKVKELEQLIKQKDESVAKLKETLTNALLGYKESGLTVTSKDGKVYVSVDEKLLFQSGKVDVDPNGKKALLKICETLKNNTDFDILIEGHTDNVPIKTARYEDNWDLSVLRATAIIRIMIKEGKIDPKKIIPAGRGEYFPVDNADSKEARAKNRRIEIILSPSLQGIMEILNK